MRQITKNQMTELLANLVKTQKLGFLLLVGVLFLITGCSETKKTDDSLQPTFTSIYSKLFISCKNCHAGVGSSSAVDDLDFSTLNQAYSDLFNLVKNPSNPSQCAGLYRVVRNDPSKSFLLGLILNTYNVNDFGGVVGCKPSVDHLSSLNYTEAEKSTLIQWIQQGAPL